MATENTSAAPAAAPAASQQPVTVPAAAPAIDPSAAGRTLAQLRNSHREALKGAAAGTDPKGTPGAPPSSSADGSSSADPVSPGSDEDEIQLLVETERRQTATARQLDARTKELETRAAALKEHEEYIPSVKAAREALKAGDHIGALRAVFPEGMILKDIFWAISKHIDANGDGETPALDLDAEFQKRLTAHEAAKQAEEEKRTTAARTALLQARDGHDAALGAGFGAGVVAEVKTIVVGGREVPLSQAPPEVLAAAVGGYAEYVESTLKEFKKNPAKYPAIAKFKPDHVQALRTLERLRRETGKVPPVPSVLKAMEDEIVDNARATGYFGAPAVAAPTKPTPSFGATSGLQRDEGGAMPPAPGGYEAKREARRQKLRAGA